MAIATGTFTVISRREDAYHEVPGNVRLTRASGAQSFAGDIDGDGSVEWLMCYLSGGRARFVGLQRIDGSIGGRSGSFVMEAIGDHDGARSTATWKVIEGSGAGDLTGLSGEGSFDAPGGPEVRYRLDYRFG